MSAEENIKHDFLGTLSDSQIRAYCSNGDLISEDYSEKNIKQCCYELRASNVYYELTDPSKPIKREVKGDDYILIKPKQNVVIITKEKLNIGSDCLGRVLSKGKLFSIGLLPINTYADPGFYGRMGVVFHNSSHHYIKIYPLEAIAKIEFLQLGRAVDHPYHGQHGYETEIWPIPTHMLLSSDEICNDSRIGEKYSELKNSLGLDFATVYKRLCNIEKGFVLSVCIYFILMFTLLGTILTADKMNAVWSIGTGIAANIIFMFLTNFVTKRE